MPAEFDRLDARSISLRAKDLFRRESYRAAIEMLKRGTILHPADARLFTQLGRFCEHIGDNEEAKKNYVQACRVDPNDVVAKTNLAEHYIRQGKGLDAEVLLKEAGHINPEDSFISAALGNLYAKLGRYSEAEKVLLAAKVSSLRDRVVISTILGEKVYLAQGRYDDAERTLLRVQSLQPSRGNGTAVILARLRAQRHAHTPRT